MANSEDSGGSDSPATNKNFELWIRMATDNKINSTNSWDFALIDYFHDMSVFRDGDGINFQKASTTLDGCVKIYSSRIDSAATETGRLLSGLSTNDSNDKNGSGNDDEDDDDSESHKVEHKKSKRNKPKNTLVKQFNQISMKNMDMELLANPIFKKALSDFDEGGSKSLLMNMLRMSSRGQVMFVIMGKSQDSILNSVDLKSIQQENDNEDKKLSEMKEGLFKLTSLTSHIQPDSKVCPSLHSLQEVGAGNASASTVLDQIGQIQYTRALSNYDDGINNDDGYDESSIDNSMQQNGRSQYSLYLEEGMDDDNESNSTFKSLNLTRLFDQSTSTAISEDEDAMDESDNEELARYFDRLSGKNWRGPEHWKISGIKSMEPTPLENKEVEHKMMQAEPSAISKTTSDDVKKHKKSRTSNNLLNFFDDKDDYDEEKLFETEDVGKMIVSERQMEMQPDFNCLPKDLQFTTKRLLSLNLKPDQGINTVFEKKRKKSSEFSRDDSSRIADESVFADIYNGTESEGINDENFFDNESNDNNEDTPDNFDTDLNSSAYDDPANDADEFEAPVELPETRKHTNGVTYARKSKRVDVRLLKERLWGALEETPYWKLKKRHAEEVEDEDQPIIDNNGLKLTDIITETAQQYTPKERKDLSTSFYFICMLHLANENNLNLEGSPDFKDITIRK